MYLLCLSGFRQTLPDRLFSPMCLLLMWRFDFVLLLSCAQPRCIVFLFVDGRRHRVPIATPSCIDRIVLLSLKSIEDGSTNFCRKFSVTRDCLCCSDPKSHASLLASFRSNLTTHLESWPPFTQIETMTESGSFKLSSHISCSLLTVLGSQCSESVLPFMTWKRVT
jgi:hypothetical protein